MGGVTEASREKIKRVFELVATGTSVTDACAREDVSITTLYRCISGDSELNSAYARARELQTLVEVDEAKAIADDPDVDPQAARNRIDIRKWRASKFHPSVFGEKLDLSISQTISMVDVLSEARNRVRSMRDSGDVIDAEVIDNKGSIADKPADDRSVGPAPFPDIFA